jgi:type IV pilus assembly protein PilA
MKSINHSKLASVAGFTLTELMVSIGIVGTLSTIAIPNYMGAVAKAQQAEVASQISNLMNNIQAYREEFLENPTNWDEISRISPVVDQNGVVMDKSGFTKLTTTNGGHYRISMNKRGSLYEIDAERIQGDRSEWTIDACIDTQTGLSDLKKGDDKTVSAGSANCGAIRNDSAI